MDFSHMGFSTIQKWGFYPYWFPHSFKRIVFFYLLNKKEKDPSVIYDFPKIGLDDSEKMIWSLVQYPYGVSVGLLSIYSILFLKRRDATLLRVLIVRVLLLYCSYVAKYVHSSLCGVKYTVIDNIY